MLFKQFARTDKSYKRATETDFGFFERCAWQEANNVRMLLESCLLNYPRNEQAELVARIRSGNNNHFMSGIFELFLHEYLLRLGFILHPHPKLPNGSNKRPDFRVVCPNGEQLYLEAVCTAERDTTVKSAETRKAVALQCLNSAYHPDFIIEIDSTGDPVTQPSGKRLASHVVSWLNALDADDVLAQSVDDYETYPAIQWEHEDWKLRLRAWPVGVKQRGKPRQLIGIRNDPGGQIEVSAPIRDAIVEKTNRYGALDLPLVVAVNSNTFDLSPEEELEALFGGITETRKGAWLGPDGAHGKRCSGAWLFIKMAPYSIVKLRHTLYVNPWANFAVPSTFLRMPHVYVGKGGVRRNVGLTFREVLGVSEHWPY